MSSYGPSLTGKVPPLVEQYLRRLSQQVQEQSNEIKKLKARPSQVIVTPSPVAPSKPSSAPAPSVPAPTGTPATSAPATGGVTDAQIRSIRSQLSATGTNPLLISSLGGESGQVQPSKFPYVTSLPDPSSSPLSQDGAVILVGATVPLAVAYRFNALTNQWLVIPAGGSTPVSGNERVYLQNRTSVVFNGAAATDGILHVNPSILPSDFNTLGKILRIHATGGYTTQAGQTPILLFKLGLDMASTPSVLLQWQTAATQASTINQWEIDAHVSVNGPGGVGVGALRATGRLSAALTNTTFIENLITANPFGGFIDLTMNHSLDFVCQFSTQTGAAPSNSITQTWSLIELLN